jgi:hypothetical protein
VLADNYDDWGSESTSFMECQLGTTATHTNRSTCFPCGRIVNILMMGWMTVTYYLIRARQHVHIQF